MKFVPVDPNEIDDTIASHRGRVSYPLLKQFLESGVYVARLDRTGMQQSYQALFSSLTGYIRRHHLPIKVFSRGGEAYFMRLDIDKDGKPIEDWEAKELKEHVDKVTELNNDLVDKHFGKAK